MAEQPRTQGPAKGVLDTVHRIATIVVGIVETRVRLAVIEWKRKRQRCPVADDGGYYSAINRFRFNEFVGFGHLGD